MSGDGIAQKRTLGDRPPAFTVTFRCENCGDVWDHDFPAGVEVGRDYVGITRKVVAREGQFSNAEQTVVDCPTCELTEPVRTDDRNPIEEGDDD